MEKELASILHSASPSSLDGKSYFVVGIDAEQFICLISVLKFYIQFKGNIVLSPLFFNSCDFQSPPDSQIKIIEAFLQQISEFEAKELDEFSSINSIALNSFQSINSKVICQMLLMWLKKIYNSLLPVIFDYQLQIHCSEILQDVTASHSTYRLTHLSFPSSHVIKNNQDLLMVRYFDSQEHENIANAFKMENIEGLISYNALVVDHKNELVGHIEELVDFTDLKLFIANFSGAITSNFSRSIKEFQILARAIHTIHTRGMIHQKLAFENIGVTWDYVRDHANRSYDFQFAFKLTNLEKCAPIDQISLKNKDCFLPRQKERLLFNLNWKKFGEIIRKFCFFLWETSKDTKLMEYFGSLIGILKASNAHSEDDFYDFIVKYFDLFPLGQNDEDIPEDLIIASLANIPIKGNFKSFYNVHGVPKERLNFECNGFETSTFAIFKGHPIAHFSVAQGARFTKLSVLEAQSPIILIFLDPGEEKFKGTFNFNHPRSWNCGDWMVIDRNMHHSICFCPYDQVCAKMNPLCNPNIPAMDLALLLQEQFEKDGTNVEIYPKPEIK